MIYQTYVVIQSTFWSQSMQQAQKLQAGRPNSRLYPNILSIKRIPTQHVANQSGVTQCPDAIMNI